MKLGYISQIGTPYEKVNNIPIDEVLIKKLKAKHDVTLLKITDLTKVSKLKNYDYIFLGFNMWKLYLEDKYYDTIFKKLPNLNNLSVPVELIKMLGDKCKLHKYYDKHKIPTLHTTCISIKELSQNKFNTLSKNKNTFVKPNPGTHTENTKIHKYKNNLKNYIQLLKKKEYEGVIVQPYMKNFATYENPEIRTIWVGHKFSHGVKTHGTGEIVKYMKRIPKKLKELSLKIIKQIEKDFKFNVVYLRLDYGKHETNYFLNEMEMFPGVFPEGNPELFDLISNRITNIFKNKINNIN